MFTLLARWRQLLLALASGIVLIAASMSASTPAAAYPVQAVQPGNLCPAGWTLINAGPLGPPPTGPATGPYCGENSGNPDTGCPAGYTQTNLPGAFGPIPVCNLNNSSAAQDLLNYARRVPAAKAALAQDLLRLKFSLSPWSDAFPMSIINDITIDKDTIKRDPNTEGLHLGMYVSSGPANPIDAYGLGGASLTRGNNSGLTHSAGIVAPGTTFGFKDTSGSGSIAASYGLSGLPINQGLSFFGSFTYQSDNFTLTSIADQTGDVASAQTNTYSFSGAARYNVGQTYLFGSAGYNFGNGSETMNLDGSTGSFITHGYWADLNSVMYSCSSTRLHRAVPLDRAWPRRHYLPKRHPNPPAVTPWVSM